MQQKTTKVFKKSIRPETSWMHPSVQPFCIRIMKDEDNTTNMAVAHWNQSWLMRNILSLWDLFRLTIQTDDFIRSYKYKIYIFFSDDLLDYFAISVFCFPTQLSIHLEQTSGWTQTPPLTARACIPSAPAWHGPTSVSGGWWHLIGSLKLKLQLK